MFSGNAGYSSSQGGAGGGYSSSVGQQQQSGGGYSSSVSQAGGNPGYPVTSTYVSAPAATQVTYSTQTRHGFYHREPEYYSTSQPPLMCCNIL